LSKKQTINEFRGEYAFLSNFTYAPTDFDGDTYPTAEHAYQAAKTLNIEERKRIQKLSTPGEAKKAGKLVTLRKDWESIKLKIMECVVRQKFLQNPDLAASLINTGSKVLREGNNWKDNYWGVDRRTGKGENHLGKILMMVRNELAKDFIWR
jgi:ribA/ribD-fused uncharacterized protein